jgi:hypothetical protein
MRTFNEEGQLIISFFVSEERKKKMSYLRLGNVVRTYVHTLNEFNLDGKETFVTGFVNVEMLHFKGKAYYEKIRTIGICISLKSVYLLIKDIIN